LIVCIQPRPYHELALIPDICMIHDIGEQNGERFIAMLLEEKTITAAEKASRRLSLVWRSPSYDSEAARKSSGTA
jgi:hypothetical protein